MASKLLDRSAYGLKCAFQKGFKVLGYHVLSATIVAFFAALAEAMGKLSIAHPAYGVYLAAAIAGVNFLAVVVNKWLSSVNPDNLSATPADGNSSESAIAV